MQNLLGYGGVSVIKQGVIRHYIGDARLSWVDGEDVAAVAAQCLRAPERHHGQTYRLGYDAKNYHEIAKVFTRVVGQPFSYEARPPDEFYAGAVAAGADPAYMACAYRNYVNLTAGKPNGEGMVFDNFTGLTAGVASTIEDFAKKHADRFRY